MPAPLREGEYRLLVESSPVMIWRAGRDARCDYFNSTWLQYTGRTLQQELGDGWTEGIHPDDHQACVDLYLDHFERRLPFEMEYRLRRHDGLFRYIFDRGVPLHDEHGEFAGYIGSCIDVEDRIRAQADREKRGQEQLAIAQQFEQWVLAIVSHDIRNPLTSIGASAQLVLKHAVPESQAALQSARILRGAERIKHLVDDLLDLSRTRAIGIPVNPELIDLERLCGEVLEELESTAGAHTIRFHCNGDASGLWDGHRLAQAVSNLVANAIQHSPPDSAIDVRVRADADPVVFEVHNDGHIPPEVLPVLFNPFGSNTGRPRMGGGLGLGLFIANAIARAHSGNIHVDSSPQTGTTFSLVLPRGAYRARSLSQQEAT